MKFITDMDKGILGQPDSYELWHEILSQPTMIEACRNAKNILVVAGGHGTEVDVLVDLHGSDITKKITFNDQFACFTNLIMLKYSDINTVEGDFMTCDIKKKFEVVIGNPPFKNAESKGTYANIWDKFVLRSFNILNEHGMMAMITPQTWYTQPRLNKGNSIAKVASIIEKHSIVVKTIDVDKYFSVSSTFSYYILSKDKSNTVLLNNKLIQNKILFESLKTADELLIDRIISNSIFSRSENASSKGKVMNVECDVYKYPVLISQNRIDFTDIPSKYHHEIKAIFLVRTAFNKPVFDYEGNLSAPPGSTSSTYVFKDKQSLKNFETLFDTKFYKFIISKQRKHHAYLSSKTTSMIPFVDLSKSWTDKELYKYFNLTKQEIAYIETTVK